MREAIPPGWLTTPISSLVADAQSGFASGEKDVPNGLRQLRMNNIGTEGHILLDLIRTVPVSAGGTNHRLEPGDVLVCTTNSAKLVGKCALFTHEGEYAFSNHLTRLRPKPDAIDSQFLNWALWERWKAGAYDDSCKHWVNQSTLPKESLLATLINVPPFNEQRRIVAKLEALLAKVDTSRKRLERVPTILKRFRQAVLSAACEGRLTEDWREENQDIAPAVVLLEMIKESRVNAGKGQKGAHRVSCLDGSVLRLDDSKQPEAAIPQSWL